MKYITAVTSGAVRTQLPRSRGPMQKPCSNAGAMIYNRPPSTPTLEPRLYMMICSMVECQALRCRGIAAHLTDTLSARLPLACCLCASCTRRRSKEPRKRHTCTLPGPEDEEAPCAPVRSLCSTRTRRIMKVRPLMKQPGGQVCVLLPRLFSFTVTLTANVPQRHGRPNRASVP